MMPILTCKDFTILEGYEMSLGETLNINQAVLPVNSKSMGYKKHKSTAGDYLALGTISQSISPLILTKLQNRMNNIKTILESNDTTQIETLDRDDIVGNMHYATMLGYYAQLLGQTKMLQQASNVHETIIGYGTFGTEVAINDRFGLPTGIKSGGIGLDIPITKVVIADNDNQQNYKNYRLQAGMLASSLEHLTPEQMYNTDPNNPIQGISTMKAFALANAQGQKIYTLNQENISQTLPKITASSLVKGAISSAVATGHLVSVHEKPVSVTGWTGTGYMVINETTGDGAFMIGGGGNGGKLKISFMSKLQFWLGMLSGFLNNHPVLKKALTGGLGIIIGKIKRIIDLIGKCKSTSGVVAIVGLYLVWNISYLILSLGLVASGVGTYFLYAVGILEFYIEGLFQDTVEKLYCRQNILLNWTLYA